jgi:hypothetical protein
LSQPFGAQTSKALTIGCLALTGMLFQKDNSI